MVFERLREFMIRKYRRLWEKACAFLYINVYQMSTFKIIYENSKKLK